MWNYRDNYYLNSILMRKKVKAMEQNKHDMIVKAYWDIWERAQSDPEYACMLEELNELESLYVSILGALTPEQRDLIDRVVTLRESMNRRMLEFACEAFAL